MPTSHTQALSIDQWFNEETTKLMNRLGAFFAFGNKQFSEKSVAGEDYVALGAGMYGPRANKDKLNTQLNDLIDLKIKKEKEIEKDGLKNIIVRELHNHECFYTGDITDAVDALTIYGATPEDVLREFNEINNR